jgi:poly(3-hydroxybutyrate) depolymerase
MLAYVPADLPRRAPLVVVLHGCTQTAAAYDHGTE